MNRHEEWDRVDCDVCGSGKLADWNCGGEHYANVTKACEGIARRIRSGE